MARGCWRPRDDGAIRTVARSSEILGDLPDVFEAFMLCRGRSPKLIFAYLSVFCIIPHPSALKQTVLCGISPSSLFIYFFVHTMGF